MNLSRATATLLGTLSLAWEVPAERVLEELGRERERAAHAARARSAERRELARAESGAADEAGDDDVVEMDGVLSLDGWKRRRGRRRRTRVDQRGGRGFGGRRGRAA